jgi:hypothetical protein
MRRWYFLLSFPESEILGLDYLTRDEARAFNREARHSGGGARYVAAE